MAPCRPRSRRRASYWLVVVATALFMSLEPSFFLVVLALALSALALFWILLLARVLLADAVEYLTHRTEESSRRLAP